MSNETKNKSRRKTISKGVSALPEWWAELEKVSNELATNKSLLIRLGVNKLLAEYRESGKII